ARGPRRGAEGAAGRGGGARAEAGGEAVSKTTGGAQDPVLAALAQAAKGLKYTSEAEAPLEPFVWDLSGGLTAHALRGQGGAGTGEPVEADTLDNFFRAVPPEDRAKFVKLAGALRGLLAGVKVYRVGGAPEKLAVIVGQAANGKWAGLKTAVVET